MLEEKSQRILFIINLLLILNAALFGVDFIDYYNNPDNWTGGSVENGDLMITEPVELTCDVVIKDTVQLILEECGELKNNGYALDINGDPDGIEENDPRKIFVTTKVMPVIINYLLSE